MVLRDNLVHGDLHPGNLLVRAKAAGDGGVRGQANSDGAMQVVMLDAGLCVELTPQDQRNFIDLFAAVRTPNPPLPSCPRSSADLSARRGCF
jgi:aarF domain-containing kinase